MRRWCKRIIDISTRERKEGHLNKLEGKEGDICRFLQELDRTTVTTCSLTTKSKKKSAIFFLRFSRVMVQQKLENKSENFLQSAFIGTIFAVLAKNCKLLTNIDEVSLSAVFKSLQSLNAELMNRQASAVR